jgi:hypothetical protein
MRIRGRRLYPDTLRERRLLMQLGGIPLYAPRGISPYLIARRLTRAAASDVPDVGFVRELLAGRAPIASQSRFEGLRSEATSAPSAVST